METVSYHDNQSPYPTGTKITKLFVPPIYSFPLSIYAIYENHDSAS